MTRCQVAFDYFLKAHLLALALLSNGKLLVSNDKNLNVRRYMVYTCGVIQLTLERRTTVIGNLLHKHTQMQKIVQTQPRTTTGALGKRIGFVDVCPRGGKRAQPPLIVKEHHSVFPPVQFARDQYKTSATPGVEWMGDFKLYGCLIFCTACSSGPTRSPKLS